MALIRLQAKSLSLLISDGPWAEVSVETTQGRIIVGSDARNTILTRLLSAIESASLGPPIGKINGTTVAWITTLAEQHGSLFVGDTADGRHVCVQNADGKTLADMLLTDATKEEWVYALSGAEK